jgi:hypothetical protein
MNGQGQPDSIQQGQQPQEQGQPSFTQQQGQTGFGQQGQSGFTQQGQPNFGQQGQSGFTQQGQPNFGQQGQQNFTQWQGQPNFTQQQGQQFHQNFDATKMLFSKLLPIIKNPVEELKNIAATKDISLGIQMILLNVIVSLLGIVMAMAVTRLKLGDAARYMAIPYARIVVAGTVTVAANYFATAGILFGFSKAFAKGAEVTFSQSITAVGGKALYDAAVLVLGVICMLLNTGFGAFVLVAGYGATYILMVLAYCESVRLSSTAKLYVLAITKVCMLLVMYLVCRVVLMPAVENIFTSAFSSIFGGALSGLSDLY